MKHFYLLIFIKFLNNLCYGQSIDPAEDFERCPTVSYPNGAGYSYTITFNDTAAEFSISNKVNCDVTAIQTTGDVFKGTVIVKFKDQSAGSHSFQILKGSTVVKTFTFTRIRSIADRTLSGVPSSVSVPLCSTSVFSVSFNAMKYRKTGSSNSTDDWGANLPFYEYQLPAGWTITGGFVGNSGTPGLYIGTNNVQIQPDALNTGEVKVRTLNAPCDPNAIGIIKQSQWSTVSITGRPALSLTTASGAKTLTLQCSDNTDKTFVVQNGSIATCATYTWNITGRGWQDVSTGSTTTFTTSVPSVTLRSTGIKTNPTKNVVVTITAGTSVLSDSVTVNFTYKNADIVPFDVDICTTNKTFTLDSITPGTNVTWLTTGYLTPASGTGATAVISPVGPDPAQTGLIRFNYDDVCILETTDVRNLNVNPIVEGHIRINGASAVPLQPYIYLPVNPCFVSLDVYPNTACVNWQKTQGTANNIVTYGCGKTLEFTSGGNQIIIFQMTGNTGCSASTTLYFVPPNTGPGGGNFRVSPNPGNGNITIDSKDRNIKIKEVRVIDKTGNLKTIKVYSGLNSVESLLIQNLPADIYTMMIYDGVNWESKQVIKQ